MDFDQHEQWQRIIYIVILQVKYFSLSHFSNNNFVIETRPLISANDEPFSSQDSEPPRADNFGKSNDLNLTRKKTKINFSTFIVRAFFRRYT